MKRKHNRILALAAATALCLGLSTGLAGCGARGGSSAASVAATMESYNASADYDAMPRDAATGGMEGSSLTIDPNLGNSDRKIIYNASVRMESTDFEGARTAVNAAVTAHQGYVEYTDLSGDAKDADRYLYLTIRVPVVQYSDFLAALGKAGNVLNLNESAQDITTNYIDVEARIAALEAQRDRLNELADSAETTADLLEIESQLSDVQYQLENYTRQMRAMDDQVSYSTVDVVLNEVATLTPSTTTFLERLSAAFTGGWQGFILLVQGIILSIVYLLPLLVLVAAVAVLVVLLRRAWRKKHPAAPKANKTPYTPANYDATRSAAPSEEKEDGSTPKY